MLTGTTDIKTPHGKCCEPFCGKPGTMWWREKTIVYDFCKLHELTFRYRRIEAALKTVQDASTAIAKHYPKWFNRRESWDSTTTAYSDVQLDLEDLRRSLIDELRHYTILIEEARKA